MFVDNACCYHLRFNVRFQLSDVRFLNRAVAVFWLKQSQIRARRTLPSGQWALFRMTMCAPGVAEWATAAMRRTGLDTQYELRGAFRACGLAVRTGGLTPSKSFVGTSCAPSSRRPIGTTMPSRWPWMPWLPACLPRPRVYDLNHSRSMQRRCIDPHVRLENAIVACFHLRGTLEPLAG